jgi:predicted DNA-binding transcriptional regulator YafY
MPKSPNASLSQIRWSIQFRRALEFEYGGQEWKVEPHDLTQAARHSLVLHSWVIEGSVKNAWLVFRFSAIRNCRVLAAEFPTRDMPPVLLEWRGPEVAVRTVARKSFRSSLSKPQPSDG